jgi:hypothetical protein
MNVISWIFIVTGALAVAYGVNVAVKQQVEIYRRGEIHLYQGKAAVMIGIGFALAGAGVTIIGSVGFTPLAIGVGIVCSLSFLVLRHFAEQMNTGVKLALPTRRKNDD